MVEEDVTLGACNLDGKRIMDDGAIGSAPEGAKSDAKRGKIGRSVLLSIAWRILTIGKDGKSADRPLNDVVREINFITGQQADNQISFSMPLIKLFKAKYSCDRNFVTIDLSLTLSSPFFLFSLFLSVSFFLSSNLPRERLIFDDFFFQRAMD